MPSPVRAPTVLIVDDDPAMLRALARLLNEWRPAWTILLAQLAREGIEVLERERVDVLVTDVHMPGMSGTELLEIVSERFPALMRVVHSAGPPPEDEERLAVLAHAILIKPVQPERFVREIEAAIERATRASGSMAG
jgi:DNA-binding NtrC family response regulator